MLAPDTSLPAPSGIPEQQLNHSPNLQSCPQCGVALDVGELEPLASVTCPQCEARFTTSSELLQFRLESVLGQGGMGTVYKAYDNSLGRHVALKLLRSDYTANVEYLERLNDEAAIMAQLSHPNVVRVFSIGEDRGQFFLAMELIQHGTLDDVLQNQGQLAEIQALDIGIQAAKGLKAAYEAGVLHRDVKPGNILFVNNQTVKITDFGLAELTDSKSSESDEIIGTPYYIPPERLNREPEDCRSDIYSLGATLFHTIAGRPPFEASDATAVALKHLKAQPVSLATYAPHVSGPTVYVINRTLLKDPNQRYQSYAELIEHLEYARNELITATGKPQGRARVVLEDEGQQKLWAWVSLGMLAVVALGGGGFLLFRDKPAPEVSAANKTGSAIAAEIT
ncbi:MAG: serine/threonine protein kinase, partial [Verrucomicrobiaceae bacterium]